MPRSAVTFSIQGSLTVIREPLTSLNTCEKGIQPLSSLLSMKKKSGEGILTFVHLKGKFHKCFPLLL